jgi:hypothetical protein
MRIEVTIQGISPLLMNRFTEENEIKVTNGMSSVQLGDKGTPREQADRKAYKDKKGNLYIPGQNIYAALISAGRFHKVGKSKVTTQKTSLIPAGIFILDTVIPLGTKQYEIDSRSVVIPSTGGRIMCHRPRLDEWAAKFNLDIDTEMFNEKFVRQIVDDAGKKVGIGDFRPERKGVFGRFVVKEWKVAK